MSDRFRFRVMDSVTGRYDIGFWLERHGKLCTLKLPYYALQLIEDQGRYVVEQCTGEKDQSGHLIFEGDVVSVYNPLADAWYDCVVAWEPDAAGYVCRYLDPKKVVRGCAYASKDGTYFEGASCRVIGNIHEWKGGKK